MLTRDFKDLDLRKNEEIRRKPLQQLGEDVYLFLTTICVTVYCTLLITNLIA